MASVIHLKSGERRIQFVGLDRVRRTVYLGKCSKTFALTLTGHIEHLLSSAAAGEAPPVRTAEFLSALSDVYHEKLVKAGLLNDRVDPETAVMTLERWIERTKQLGSHLKGTTRLARGYAWANAIAFFGATTPLCAITPGLCDDFAKWLITEQKLSPATAGRRLRTVKGLFRSAMRHELLDRNPAEGIKEGSQANPARQHFVDRATITRVLAACPDTEWRLLVALARYGGLRVPSEALMLRWSDVDWEHGRLTVWSPKTEHHVGKDRRLIPLFPELQAALNDRWEVAADGAEFLFDRLRRVVSAKETGWQAVNLRTQFARILEQAGVTPWPRLWVNLRSSCETELAERFPAHVSAGWLGHTPEVARRHYLQTLDSHFAQATGRVIETTHFPTHTPAESACIGGAGVQRIAENQLENCISIQGDCPVRTRT